MTMALTPEQAAQVAPHLRAGWVLLGRVLPEPFNGTNAETSGRLALELGTVKESALPALRQAILKANATPAKRARKAEGDKEPNTMRGEQPKAREPHCARMS